MSQDSMQVSGISSFPSPYELHGLNSVVRLGGKGLYSPAPVSSFSVFLQCGSWRNRISDVVK